MLRTVLLSCLLWVGIVPMVTGNDDLEDINFPLNSSVVVDGFQGLDMLATVMAKHTNLDLEVVGHTDSIGSAPYNKRLSLKRAEQVKAYLVTKGASEGKIKTNGDGIDSSHDNATREGRFQNRRVSLNLYESNGAIRSRVTYPRLLELFFGGGSNMQALEELKEKAGQDNAEVLAKLSELQDQMNAMNDALQRRIGNLEKAHAELAQRTEDLPSRASMAMQVGKYGGVSVSAGVDDESEFTGQIRGMYFRTIGEHFAVQAQGDASYYDSHEDGQADLAAVYQKGGFKLAAAGSYKWASLPGFDAVRAAQGALIADWRFGSGKFGVFGTFPIADGDVVGTSNGPTSAYTVEHYVSVPTQVGLDFGVSIGDRLDLSGYAASLDAEQSEADLSAGLKLDVLIKDNLSWFVAADMNESLLDPTEDLTRYQIGLKLGSWVQARYNVTDQITPVNIPRVHYELLSRVVRTGNTTPIADAGASRTNVAAGSVTLDGSNSSDPEGDALSFKWTQTAGPTVEIANANQAVASFTGVAGEAYTFQLSVRDALGATGTDVVSVAMEAAPIPDPEITIFLANPPIIDRGQVSTLYWTTDHTTDVSIDGVGQVPPTGELVVVPEETHDYTLVATNEEGDTVSATVTVTVIQPAPTPAPEISFFTAIPDNIMEGELSTISWSTKYAENVAITGLGAVNASGSLVLSPDSTVTYELVATNESGSASASVTITVTPIPPINNPPIADAGLDRQVPPGGTVSLNGTRSLDPDGDTLSYSWVQIGGPSTTLSGADTATPSFPAEPGVYHFRLTVTDPSGDFDSDDVTIHVLEF